MKSFDWTKFTLRLAVKAKLSDLYNAWTKASEIEKWFLSNARYFDNGVKMVPKDTSVQAGYTYSWSWYTYDVIESGKITEANGKDHLQFTFAGDCLVDVLLTEEGEHTMVELTMKNIPTDEDSMKNIRLDCDRGWTFYMLNLKSIYEGGVDLRNKNSEFKKVINS